MIAHLQQRAEERRREEELRTSLYDNNLAELEQQEYELILSLQTQRVRAWPPRLAPPCPVFPKPAQWRHLHACRNVRAGSMPCVPSRLQEEHHNVYRALEQEMSKNQMSAASSQVGSNASDGVFLTN